jgi:hypothetical protein
MIAIKEESDTVVVQSRYELLDRLGHALPVGIDAGDDGKPELTQPPGNRPRILAGLRSGDAR